MQDPNLVYISTKTYTHNEGLSVCFRQWRANSHCKYLHGYALKVEVVFQGDLDERNWVQDFGGLQELKNYLHDVYDHTTIVARDDPELQLFQHLSAAGLIQLVVLAAVGMEKFAEDIFGRCVHLYGDKVKSVQVWEHEGNSALVYAKGVHNDDHN